MECMGIVVATFVALSAPGATPRDGDDTLVVVAERVELRWSSTGRLLGWLARGAVVERLGGRDGWTRIQVSGWVQAGALERSGETYRVVEPGAPLRTAAGGALVGGLEPGVEVRRRSDGDEWYEIEMIAWVPDETVAPAESASATDPAPAGDSADDDPAEAERPPTPMQADVGGPVGRVSGRVALRTSPEGRVLAEIPDEATVRALETRGRWTRVAIEGWVPSDIVRVWREGAPEPEVVAAAAPDAFAGQTVVWTLEHVAIQEADEWRHDFTPGEVYALARVPNRVDLYVYVVLPDGLVMAFRDLPSFATVRVEGTVRTGRSELTGSPIIEATRRLP